MSHVLPWLLFLITRFFLTDILYLESKQKLHRDISYTNILLREQGKDSEGKVKIRQELEKHLGLTDIEKTRQKLNCREGLLIDFDYATGIDQLWKGKEPQRKQMSPMEKDPANEKEGQEEAAEEEAKEEGAGKAEPVSGIRTVR